MTWIFYAREEIARSESGLLEIAELRPELLSGDVAILAEPTDGAVEAGCQGTLRVGVDAHRTRAPTPRAPTPGATPSIDLADVILRVAELRPRTVVHRRC